jgi:anti-anti-sigma factor
MSVVIDLQGLTFVSSRQLGVMLTVRKALSPDMPVSLVNVSSGLSRILAITGLERHFVVTDAEPADTESKAAGSGSAN